jgi:hypothetical protein
MKSHVTTKELINLGHCTVTIVLGMDAKVDDLDLHHQNITIAHDTRKPKIQISKVHI